MTLEEEMRHEVARLERELEVVDTELEKLHAKILHLLEAHKKDEHALKALRGSFEEDYIRQVEAESLEKIIKGKVKV